MSRDRFRTIASAESFLRKLSGDDCTLNIRMHRHIDELNGRVITNEQWRIEVETADAVTVDSGQQPSLDRSVQVVWRAIVAERVARTTSRRKLVDTARQ